MSTVTVTQSNFDEEVLQSKAPVVVDFWADWCVPCRAIAPALEEIAAEMAGKVKIAKLNTENEPDLVSRYGVRSVPTLLIFRDGQLIGQKVGAVPKGDLARWIQASV